MERKLLSPSPVRSLLVWLTFLFIVISPVGSQETTSVVPSGKILDSDGDGIPDEMDPDPLVAEIQNISWRILPARVGWDFSGSIEDIRTDLKEDEVVQLTNKSFSFGGGAQADASIEAASKGTLSGNPFKLFGLGGSEASVNLRSRMAVDGYVRGNKDVQDRASDLRKLVSNTQVTSRLTGFHLDFTVNFFNYSKSNFSGVNLEIPVRAGDNVVAIAQAWGAGGPVERFNIPAGRERAIPVRFRANLDTTQSLALLDEMASGSMLLAIEDSQGGIVAEETGTRIDAISALVGTSAKTCEVRVEVDGETYTWMVARRNEATGQALTVGDALSAINAWATRHSVGDSPLKLFETNELYLRSAFGKDNAILPVSWWRQKTDGSLVGGEDVRLEQKLGAKVKLVHTRVIPEEMGHWVDYVERTGEADSFALTIGGRAIFGDDATQAVEWWRKAAEMGEAGAMVNLGLAYYNGKGGLPKDPREAVEWWRKAAELGNEAAMVNMGEAYFYGIFGLPEDPRQAVEWYRKAAELGNTAAMLKLGKAYFYGIGGLPEDQSQAVEWYRKAEEAGYELDEAMKALMRSVP